MTKMISVRNRVLAFILSCAGIDARMGATAFLACVFNETWAQTFFTPDAPTPKEVHVAMLTGVTKYDLDTYRTAPAGLRTVLRALELASRQMRGVGQGPNTFRTHAFSSFKNCTFEYLVGGGPLRAWVVLRLIKENGRPLATVNFAMDTHGQVSDARIVVEPSSYVGARIERVHGEALAELLHALNLGQYTWEQFVCSEVLEMETSRDERHARAAAMNFAPPPVVMPGGRVEV